jgi:transposase InsO family protein
LKNFIAKHRDTFGIEPLCKVLQVAPSVYRRHAALRREPYKRCARTHRDEVLMPQVQRVWQANPQVHGADKVWRQLAREGMTVARCTVERLMRKLGRRGVRRGKVVRTTNGDAKAPCPLDEVNRLFRAERSNQWWVSDFTYVSTWQDWLHVAFVIDVFARRIVGCLICRSDRGSEYVSIRYSEWVAEAGIKPSVGSKGDSNDNAVVYVTPGPLTGAMSKFEI